MFDIYLERYDSFIVLVGPNHGFRVPAGYSIDTIGSMFDDYNSNTRSLHIIYVSDKKLDKYQHIGNQRLGFFNRKDSNDYYSEPLEP